MRGLFLWLLCIEISFYFVVQLTYTNKELEMADLIKWSLHNDSLRNILGLYLIRKKW